MAGRIRTHRSQAGFTLLEVMIALLILALSLAAISYANNAAVSQVARITRMTTATFLMDGVVNDIHAHYVQKGFPSNTLEDRECEIPNEFGRMFTCRYSLKAMELTPEMLQSLVQAGVDAFSEAQEAGTDTTTKVPDKAMLEELAKDPAALAKKGNVGVSGVDLSQLAQLAPLFGPQAQELIGLCNINLAGIMMGLQGMLQFMPQIIDMIAKKTRLLEVQLAWDEGPRKTRQLKVQTFVVSLPEEEVAAMKEAEKARDLQEAAQTDATVRSTAPGTATTPSKTTATKREGQ